VQRACTMVVLLLHTNVSLALLLLLPRRSCPSLRLLPGQRCPACSSWRPWQAPTCWWHVLRLLLRVLLVLRGPARNWRGWG
jgi:hypothetical protein